MKRKARSFIWLFQAFIALSTMAFITCQVFAGVSSIYKWEDDLGKVHFTDDPLKIPSRYRSGPGMGKSPGLPLPKSNHHRFPKPENTANKDNIVEYPETLSKQAVGRDGDKTRMR